MPILVPNQSYILTFCLLFPQKYVFSRFQVTIKGNRHLQYGEKCCNFAKVIALQNWACHGVWFEREKTRDSEEPNLPNFTPCLLLIRISFRLYLDFMAESKAQFISYNPCFWRSITALLKKSSTSSSTTTLSIVWAMSWTRTRSKNKESLLLMLGECKLNCVKLQ